MTWSWSHTQEGLAAVRDNLEKQTQFWLEQVWAEWKSSARFSGGFFYPRGRFIITTEDFDLDRYERALCAIRSRQLPVDVLADKIYELAERQAACTNGGHFAHVCPFYCGPHDISFSSSAPGD